MESPINIVLYEKNEVWYICGAGNSASKWLCLGNCTILVLKDQILQLLMICLVEIEIWDIQIRYSPANYNIPMENPRLSWYILSTRWIFHDYFAYFPMDTSHSQLVPLKKKYIKLYILSPYSPRYVFFSEKKDSTGDFPQKKQTEPPKLGGPRSWSLRVGGPVLPTNPLTAIPNQPSKVALVVQLCLR